MASGDIASECGAMQTEELDVIKAIYGDDVAEMIGGDVRVLGVCVRSDGRRPLEMRILIPTLYPLSSAPLYEAASDWASRDPSHSMQIASGLDAIACEAPGEIILFRWIEWLREYVADNAPLLNPVASTAATPVASASSASSRASAVADDDGYEYYHADDGAEESCGAAVDYMSLADEPVRGGASAPDAAWECPDIRSGDPFVDRRSTFQAHVARVVSKAQVQQVLAVLKSNRKIAHATHNIMAYRMDGTSEATCIQDCDDDGEQAAGGRLLHLLQVNGVRNAVVVVSRWYGGIQLGPDRFRHINNCAREALLMAGVLGPAHTGKDDKGKGTKKRK